MMVEAVGHG